jgi:hypothetical protein
MDAWNRKVTKDLPNLIESLKDYCDVDDVTYILEGIRVGLERLRLATEKDKDDETVGVGYKVLGRAEKRLRDLINQWAPTWREKGWGGKHVGKV